jgi:hypothetical protein
MDVMDQFYVRGYSCDGELMYEDKTESKWFLTEIDYHMHRIKHEILDGRVDIVTIERDR